MTGIPTVTTQRENMRIIYLIILLPLSVMASSCSQDLKKEMDTKLAKDMTQAQVIAAIGDPTEIKCSSSGITIISEPSDCWVYEIKDWYMQVYFYGQNKLYHSHRFQNGMNYGD